MAPIVNTAVLEDDKDTLEVIQELFQENGIENYALYSEANDLLKNFSEDTHLLVLDYILTGALSGFDVMKLVREKNPDCYVIVTSGQYDRKVVIEFLRNRADDYIDKNEKGYLIDLIESVKKGIVLIKKKIEIAQDLARAQNEIKSRQATRK